MLYAAFRFRISFILLSALPADRVYSLKLWEIEEKKRIQFGTSQSRLSASISGREGGVMGDWCNPQTR